MLKARSILKSPSGRKPCKTVRFHPYAWNGAGLAYDPKLRSMPVVALERFPWDLTSDPKISSSAFVRLEQLAESIAAEQSVPTLIASPEVLRQKRKARLSSSGDDSIRVIWRSPLVVTPTNATGYAGYWDSRSSNSSMDVDIPPYRAWARQIDFKSVQGTSKRARMSPDETEGLTGNDKGSMGISEGHLQARNSSESTTGPHRLAVQADVQGLARCDECLDDDGDGTMHTCLACKKGFVTKAMLTNHLRANSACRPLECGVCFKRYTSQRWLSSHLHVHSDSSAHICSVCDKRFPTRIRLTHHMVTHNKLSDHMCETCNYACPSAHHLKMHLRVHLKEKAFKCHICPSAFTTKGNLADHLKTHRNETPFCCSICSYATNRKRRLDEHVVRIHTKDLQFECEICSKAFATKHDLALHRASHETVKNYICQFCPLAQKTQQSLTAHLNKKHPAEMAKLRAEKAAEVAKQSAGGGYVCETCGKVYRELGQCGTHGTLLRIPVVMDME